MPTFKAPDNSIHFVEPEFERLLPAGCVQITDAEAASIRNANAPIRNIPAEIDALERTQLMPRATREFMLGYMESQFTAAQLAQNPGYQAVKAFDNQIVELRKLL